MIRLFSAGFRVIYQDESHAAMSESKASPDEPRASPALVFTVRLTQEDWDSERTAWRCPALAIPKAEVSDLFADGNRIDKEKYKIIEGPPSIRWTSSNPPARVTAQIQLPEELTLISETDRWKKLAIALPVVASIVVALIGAVGSYLTKPGSEITKVTDLITATFTDWDVDEGKKSISYRFDLSPFEQAKFIKKSEKDNFKLIVGVRPRSATPLMDGEYDRAFGPYSFDSTPPQVPLVDDKLQSFISTGCVDLILFRVSLARLATVPFKTPFAPTYYGSDLKLLESKSQGTKCP
jgi:hypothetical protein